MKRETRKRKEGDLASGTVGEQLGTVVVHPLPRRGCGQMCVYVFPSVWSRHRLEFVWISLPILGLIRCSATQNEDNNRTSDGKKSHESASIMNYY